MVSCLLDTAILVDLIRQYPPAQTWIVTQAQPGVSTIVWLEVLQGAQNKPDQQRALKLLQSLERVEVVADDFDYAITSLLRYGLSHNVGAFDCLIASVNHRLQVPLFTRNLKHFVPMLGTLVQQPYS